MYLLYYYVKLIIVLVKKSTYLFTFSYSYRKGRRSSIIEHFKKINGIEYGK